MALQPLVRRLSHSSLLWRSAAGSKALKQLSQGAQSDSSPSQLLRYARRGWLFLAGLGSCAVAAWGLSRTREDGRLRVLPVAKAGGQNDGGKGKEKSSDERPKISARELRYKAFASYIYKGEPYMSAHDFLESLIRDEPRCK